MSFVFMLIHTKLPEKKEVSLSVYPVVQIMKQYRISLLKFKCVCNIEAHYTHTYILQPPQ